MPERTFSPALHASLPPRAGRLRAAEGHSPRDLRRLAGAQSPASAMGLGPQMVLPRVQLLLCQSGLPPQTADRIGGGIASIIRARISRGPLNQAPTKRTPTQTPITSAALNLPMSAATISHAQDHRRLFRPATPPMARPVPTNAAFPPVPTALIRPHSTARPAKSSTAVGAGLSGCIRMRLRWG